MSQKTFYEKLKPYTDLVELLSSRDFAEAPEDWFVIVTDIVRSTEAIKAGKYKEVNATNAAIISAVLNLNTNNYKSIPFCFGGDGATLIIPGSVRTQAIEQLAQAKLLAQSFGLAIRCCIIPVRNILQAQKSFSIGKFKISEKYTQAIFLGEGVEYAEQLAKSTQKFEVLTREYMEGVQLQSQGFTCRWEPVKSSRGETLSVIIKSRVGDNLYGRIIVQMNAIFGDADSYHPLNEQNLALSLNPNKLAIETAVLSNPKSSLFSRLLKLVRIYSENLVGKFPIIPQFKKNVAYKKNQTVLHSDYLKIDGSLKVTLSADSHQRKIFCDYLMGLYKDNQIYFGLHTNDASIITCLVFPSNDFEVHFVDGADGGYALAAEKLKKQIILK